MLSGHRSVKRAVRPAQRLKQPGEPPERRVREPGTDVPTVDKPAVGVHPHEQRADQAGPVALARLPARYHDLLAEHVLDLAPGARPRAWLIRRVEPLGDHA